MRLLQLMGALRGQVGAYALALMTLVLCACGDNAEPKFSVQQLMDPQSCAGCHPQHFADWQSSMHAYAADDPIFLAMNKRGQEETGGTLGDFCVKCHAPMALRLGLTTDGTNLPSLPQSVKGVTCYFCHNVEAVEGEHSNPLKLAMDGIMRGGLRDAVDNNAHFSAYSDLLDSKSENASAMCGACHDIVTQKGVHLERTFEEWKGSLFSTANSPSHLSCGSCHMVPYTDRIAQVAEAPIREYGRRDHLFAGVDIALTPWPGIDRQRAEIEKKLATTVLPKVCVTPVNGGEITLRLDNIGAGHMWPSGAAQDRRAWVMVTAKDADGNLLFESGNVPAFTDPETTDDAFLWRMGDEVFDKDGNPKKFFWEIDQVKSYLLKPVITLDKNSPLYDHSTTRGFPVPGLAATIEEVEVRIFIRPLPFALIDELASSGHLEATLAQSIRVNLPTFELSGAHLVWTRAKADAGLCVTK